MQTQNTSQAMSTKAERQKKFLLAFPLVAFPLFTFVLWSLGIIAPAKAVAQNEQAHKGINMTLPDAKLKEQKSWNKLSFYEQAAKDSAQWKAQVKTDPYFKQRNAELLTDTPVGTGAATGSRLSYDPSPYGLPGYKNDNEEKVYRKIAQLNSQLEQSVKDTPKVTAPVSAGISQPVAGMTSADIDRLESMMQVIGQGKEEDPEINQLNGMLEKILDIQHPERMQEKIRKTSIVHKEQVFPVTLQQHQPVSLLEGKGVAISLPDTVAKADSAVFAVNAVEKGNTFYSLEDDLNNEGDRQTAVEAVVHSTQTIFSGSTIKLRLVSDIYINGLLIPAGTFVYGAAALSGERLTVTIKSIAYRNSILPVALSVFDMDGMEGMYMPGAISRDVAKQSTDQTIQGIGLTSLDPSLAVQAASAGIDATKNLLSKKVKLVRVTIKAGYRVLLRDNNNK